MGREIRKVPNDWEHPKDKNGDFIPLLEGYRYSIDLKDPDNEPKIADYMPDWPLEKQTHYVLYENFSKGTPLSPLFKTWEKMPKWLHDLMWGKFPLSRHECRKYIQCYLKIREDDIAERKPFNDPHILALVKELNKTDITPFQVGILMERVGWEINND